MISFSKYLILSQLRSQPSLSSVGVSGYLSGYFSLNFFSEKTTGFIPTLNSENVFAKFKILN